MKKKIAVLITCHNRRVKTLACLSSFYEAEKNILEYSFSIFLVDDGSTDGTSEEVRNKFPEVNIIKGDGSLYWSGGTRLAWSEATKQDSYDFYFWLNDDVVLYKNALINLFNDYNSFKNTIIVGSFRDPVSGRIAYGGYSKNGIIPPDGKPLECETFNGNAVLVPRKVYYKVGNLDSAFTHCFGDTDYGWRARKFGFSCYISSQFVGEAESNPKRDEWANPNLKLRERIKIFNSPKGLPLKEWIIYSKRIYGKKWILSVIKLYLRLLFPRFWKNLKQAKNRNF